MAGQNKTRLIGWHPADPGLKPWAEAQAKRRGVPLARILDEALARYREQVEQEKAGG